MIFNKTLTSVCAGLSVLSILALAPVFAETNDEREKAIEVFDPAAHVAKAVQMLQDRVEKDADKRIPEKLLQSASCVVIFPEVVQAGLGIGGKFGRGIASCRQDDNSWGVPVFLRLTSLTFGLQTGAQSVDLMMLVMQEDGLNTLFAGKPIVGGEAGVAAGPVGRSASVNIDVALQSPIVSYSRAKGLFAGAIWEGATITPAKKVNRGLYGDDYADARSLLFSDVEVPESVQGLRDALEKYAPANG